MHLHNTAAKTGATKGGQGSALQSLNSTPQRCVCCTPQTSQAALDMCAQAREQTKHIVSKGAP
jgi:hypothetical protein